MKLVLTIELIPESTWGLSLAQLLPSGQWNLIRRLIYKRELYVCQVCQATNCEVHCHEVWSYSQRPRVQKLADLMCLCKDCHNIKHWGRLIHEYHTGGVTQTYKDFLVTHFCSINQCTIDDMIKYVVKMGDLNMYRSRYKYKIDLGELPKLIKEAEKSIKKRRSL